MVSHLPQVASTALMGLAASEEAGEPEILLLAAGGFRDLTRLAASSPHLWSDILLANGDAIVRAIDLYVGAPHASARADRRGRRGARSSARSARPSRRGSRSPPSPRCSAGVAVLQVPVPDRPGVLAELTSTLSDAGVNIEDLQIVHSPEGGRGPCTSRWPPTRPRTPSAPCASAGSSPSGWREAGARDRPPGCVRRRSDRRARGQVDRPSMVDPRRHRARPQRAARAPGALDVKRDGELSGRDRARGCSRCTRGLGFGSPPPGRR